MRQLSIVVVFISHFLFVCVFFFTFLYLELWPRDVDATLLSQLQVYGLLHFVLVRSAVRIVHIGSSPTRTHTHTEQRAEEKPSATTQSNALLCEES